jgi:colicin import membrane protein
MVGIFIVIGIGISGIWANEDNTGNNIDFSYQNTAQALHARNVAKQATFQDPAVARALATAKATNDPQDIQDARALFHDTLKDFSQQVFAMRSSGMGWGNIAKHLDVHPSVLGRGHAKFSRKHHFSYSKHSRKRSAIKAAAAKSDKGKDAKGHHDRGTISKGTGIGHNQGRGLALGHGKGYAGASLAGHSAGHANGHGGGHGGGNGNGNSGGHGGVATAVVTVVATAVATAVVTETVNRVLIR